jgi:PAS domain S-box-containing protein
VTRATIEQSTPDLVIADFRLPDGKGTELIPPHRETAPFPVIVLTSHGNEEVTVEAMKLGALDYVVKLDVSLAAIAHVAERAVREWSHVLKSRKAEQDRKRFESIVEAPTDIVCMTDSEGGLLYLNKAGRTFFGIGPDQNLSGKTCADLLPDWAYLVVTQTGIPRAIQEGSWTGETAFLSPGKQEIPISQVILAHKDAQGNVNFLSTIARDITKQKQAERETQDRAVANAKLSILTPREEEVLRLVVTGKANKVVAKELNLSEKTVEKYRSNLMKKLQVPTLADLVRLAVSADL